MVENESPLVQKELNPDKKAVLFFLEPDIRKAMKAKCKANGFKQSDYIVRLIKVDLAGTYV